jgi:hypothetical protein
MSPEPFSAKEYSSLDMKTPDARLFAAHRV